MWVEPKLTNLPRTKNSFYITSRNGEKFLVKPGKAFLYKNNAWNQVRSVGNLNNKIDRVVISPTGNMSLHLPKITGLLATHQNNAEALVITLPLPPSHEMAHYSAVNSINSIVPTGEHLFITSPHNRVADVPFIFGLQNKTPSEFPKHVSGLATSENGQAIAVAADKNFFIWQQLPEYEKGIGFWIDLTSNQYFTVGIESNHPYSQHGRVFHGFTKPRQYFTLSPVLAPNLPQNSAISYQDLCMFDNPDEGKGVCCITSVLPPCQPFDTLYLFNSICTFKGFQPVFQRADITLDVADSATGPCIWWSRDCRLAVIAVGTNLLIVTRFLRVIAILPLSKIFPGNDPIVADVAWSCGGQFFVITSMTGKIGAVTRSGESLRHKICSLTSFSNKQVPLLVSSDSKDPTRFVVYSNDKCRDLEIEVSIIPQPIENLMSLHFPQKSVCSYYDPTITEIRNLGTVELQNLIKLLYLTDLYRIWPYQSPLRYMLFSMFESGIDFLLNNHQDLYVFLLIRCVLRLTELPVSCYQSIIDRLNFSQKPREKLLAKIIQYELDKKDYVATRVLDPYGILNQIKMYGDDIEDKYVQLKQPHNGKNVDLLALIQSVKNILYTNEFDESIYDINVNVSLLLDLLIEYGKYDRAIKLGKHASVASDSLALYQRIVADHSDEPAIIFSAMHSCMASAPDDELSIRRLCVVALTNILKQRIAESSPTSSNTKTKFLSSLISIEEDLVLMPPTDTKQLNDFAVILGMAFAAADYPACSNFFNGRSKLTSPDLRDAVRDLFSLVWFIRWRHAAIIEAAKTGRANSATLRLIAFPQFVNQNVAKMQIKATGEGVFPPDVYVLYMNSGPQPMFEKDPVFPDFASECSNRITPRILSKITGNVLQLSRKSEEFPQSKLLIATIISHMIPWLRCGIPRALSKFKCNEIVPNELLELDDLVLPEKPPPQMTIKSLPIETIPAIEEEDESEPPPIQPITLLPPPEESSSGEFKMEPESEPEPIKLPKPKTKPKPKPKPKPKRKKPVKRDPSPPRGPKLRLLSLDPNAAPPRIPNPPYQPYYPPQPAPQPMIPQPPYLPVWDYDPSKWWKKAVKEPKPAPKTEATQTNRGNPIVILKSKQKKPKEEPSDLFISDDESIPEPEIMKGPIEDIDPFPIDDELHKRVERLLDESRDAPQPRDLPAKPEKYRRMDLREKPARKQVEKPQTPTVHSEVPPPPPPTKQPVWKPRVTNPRDTEIFGFRGMSAEQFRQGPTFTFADPVQLAEINTEGNNGQSSLHRSKRQTDNY